MDGSVTTLPQMEKEGDVCVICLENISERAVAVPCNHCTFDFLCLVSWLQEHRTCPLCKVELLAVQYDWRSPEDFATYYLPKYPLPSDSKQSSIPSRRSTLRSRQQRGARRPARHTFESHSAQQDAAISRRRHIYREQLYSLHVGSNRLSRFTDITPDIFNSSPDLQSRARTWIRRELQVFEFLSPGSGEDGNTVRRANNVEFLLSYIIALLRTVDIRSSSGNAALKVADFLGVENARLFLHELGAWLRSPYTKLEDWDRATQYADGLSGGASETPGREAHRKSMKAQDPRPTRSESWRQEQMIKRYEPD